MKSAKTRLNGLKWKIHFYSNERNESTMPITDLPERNSKLCGTEVALVAINPELR